jgi:type IV pilus biogenesis protein CpaD/CtpE
MKKIYAVLLCSLLGACASKNPIDSLPNTVLIVDKAMPPLTRNEVMNGIMDCESAGQRPVVITSRRKINGFLSEIPVEVTCMPRYIR